MICDLLSGCSDRLTSRLPAKHVTLEPNAGEREYRGGGERPPSIMGRMKLVYQHLSAGQPLVFHGGSWRLPATVAGASMRRPFLDPVQPAFDSH